MTLYYVWMELTDTMAMVNTLREQLDTSGSSHIPPLPHTRLASPGKIQKGLHKIVSLHCCYFCLLPFPSPYIYTMYMYTCMYTCIDPSQLRCFPHTFSISFPLPLSLTGYPIHVNVHVLYIAKDTHAYMYMYMPNHMYNEHAHVHVHVYLCM